jgi:aryl-alcohol dehydrogenase-like predicted oxidoreductase
VDSILVGPATVAQLDDAFDAVACKLSTDALTRVNELAREWAGGDTHYVR